MQKAFQKYTESEDFQESLEINEFFENPEGLAWGAFIAAWEATEHRMHQTAFRAWLFGWFTGALAGAGILYSFIGGR